MAVGSRRGDRSSRLTIPRVSESKTVKFVQITTGTLSGGGGCATTYEILGVSTNGRVYRYDEGRDVWAPLSDKVVPKKPRPDKLRRMI